MFAETAHLAERGGGGGGGYMKRGPTPHPVPPALQPHRGQSSYGPQHASARHARVNNLCCINTTSSCTKREQSGSDQEEGGGAELSSVPVWPSGEALVLKQEGLLAF